jgi:spermidine/putrescine transport system substrate-binding protein
VIDDFTKETGIKVIHSTFDSNEAMFVKLQLLGGNGGYDLILPSSYYLTRLKKSNLLLPLDKNKLSNLHNIDADFMNKPYDPRNQYSIPYLWGLTGILYNQKYIKNDIRKWQDLFNPDFKNQLLLLEDMREIFDIALLTLGLKPNSTNPQAIKIAFEKLQTLMPNVKIWNSESPKVAFINEDVKIGIAWNGEAYMASKHNNNLKFVLPAEGAILWMDNLAIPKGAKNIENAYKFIDFILRPEIAQYITQEIGYSTPNGAAFAMLPLEVANNQIAYPSKEYIKKCFFQEDVGSKLKLYMEYWEKLRLMN